MEQQNNANAENPGQQNAEQPNEASKTFTQDELERILAERLERDRKARDLSPEEVKTLKAQAAQAAREAESSKSEAQKYAEQLAELKATVEQSQRDALVARVQARFGISDDDAALFLTASDADELTRQAQRLAEVTASKSTSKVAAQVGANPRPTGDPERDFVRQLTGRN